MGKSRILSFKNAFEGIWTAFKEEPNLKIHFLIAFFVLVLAFWFNVSEIELLALSTTIGLVLSLELTNTAIEEIVNSFTDGIHPSAKKAKDVAAGAVLISAITAIITGVTIFLPKFIRIFS